MQFIPHSTNAMDMRIIFKEIKLKTKFFYDFVWDITCLIYSRLVTQCIYHSNFLFCGDWCCINVQQIWKIRKKSFLQIGLFFYMCMFNINVIINMHSYFEFRCIFHSFILIENQYLLSIPENLLWYNFEYLKVILNIYFFYFDFDFE